MFLLFFQPLEPLIPERIPFGTAIVEHSARSRGSSGHSITALPAASAVAVYTLPAPSVTLLNSSITSTSRASLTEAEHLPV
jgi:hypothetical protein